MREEAMSTPRSAALLCIALFSGTPQILADAPRYAPVTPGHALHFPADYGSHPEFRTEWWYVTGWLTTAHGESLGFQVTFFRSKPAVDDANPSAFTARQLLIAHCALSDPKHGRVWHDQRIRRAGLGLAEAQVGDTRVSMDRWSLERDAATYKTVIDAEDFGFELSLRETQAVLLNGEDGFSRKGPGPTVASYYYSMPHLEVTGSIARQGERDAATGEAWLDHEWSSEYLDDEAVGWDWVGINLDDGGAMMAFRIRDAQGGAHWAGGTLRNAEGRAQVLQPDDLEFRAGRSWTSPRTGITYPVAWQLRMGTREFDLSPLMDDQENDSRLSTGAIYWEGAVRVSERRRSVGRGYLEMTGYGARLRFR
jgi:predicted secreted hydrolase